MENKTIKKKQFIFKRKFVIYNCILLIRLWLYFLIMSIHANYGGLT